MKKWWDIKTTPVKRDRGCECDTCFYMRRLLDRIPRAFIHGNKAYVIVYNRNVPKRSYVVSEVL